MPFYHDTETLCGVMTELFEQVMRTPAAVQSIQRNAMVIRLITEDPDFVLTINGKSRPPRFDCDANGARPDIVLRTSADVIHQVWLNKIRLRDAFFSGQIQMEGSMLRAMSLSELFRQVEALYPGVLRRRGLSVSEN